MRSSELLRKVLEVLTSGWRTWWMNLLIFSVGWLILEMIGLTPNSFLCSLGSI